MIPIVDTPSAAISLTMLARVFDLTFTKIAVTRGAYEKNPFMRRLFSHYGLKKGILINFIVSLIVVAALTYFFGPNGPFPIFVASIGVGMWNLVMARELRRSS